MSYSKAAFSFVSVLLFYEDLKTLNNNIKLNLAHILHFFNVNQTNVS